MNLSIDINLGGDEPLRKIVQDLVYLTGSALAEFGGKKVLYVASKVDHEGFILCAMNEETGMFELI